MVPAEYSKKLDVTGKLTHAQLAKLQTFLAKVSSSHRNNSHEILSAKCCELVRSPMPAAPTIPKQETGKP